VFIAAEARMQTAARQKDEVTKVFNMFKQVVEEI
jgi:hypothetical protein